jgi:large subunit ribosomal protein L6e
LKEGALLVTGPFKINGVPLRRVNARYVIATSAKVDVKGLDEKTLEKVGGESYFTREKKSGKKGEEEFFKQGEKPEVGHTNSGPDTGTDEVQQKKKPSSARAQDQKTIDKALLSAIKKEQFLGSYLASNFSLRTGDRPHEMKF